MSSIVECLSRGVLPARELTTALGVSPPTLMRRLRTEASDIVRLGRGRATRYGLVQPWTGLESARNPVLRIDQSGHAVPIGDLVTLAARQSVWLPTGTVFEGLPVEIADAGPSGFLGRLFARLHQDLALPHRLSDWSDHHVLLALSRRGEDVPGNLIVGQESLDRWFALRPTPVTQEDYPDLASSALDGAPTGSSAGGDRPKFGAYSEGRHVLVKFAGEAQSGGPATQRWRDLLALEGLALDVLREHGLPAARAQLFASSSYRFLEVERFDRIGERGRRAVMTLAAVHQDPVDSWSRAATRLFASGRISTEDSRRLRWLDAFGALIANSDRHHHNVAFFPGLADAQGIVPASYELAPAFDQLPMLYAPDADGRVAGRAFVPPSPSVEMLDVWDEARAAALAFWQHASESPAVSDDMRAIAAANVRVLTSH